MGVVCCRFFLFLHVLRKLSTSRRVSRLYRYLLEKASTKELIPQELYLSGTIGLREFEEIRFPGTKYLCV